MVSLLRERGSLLAECFGEAFVHVGEVQSVQQGHLGACEW